NDNARAGGEQPRVVDFLNELFEHLLGDGEIGYDAIFHRAYGCYVTRRSTKHLLCSQPYFLDDFFAVRSALLPDCDDRRFIQHDTLAADIDQGIGSAEVDCQIVREVTV